MGPPGIAAGRGGNVVVENLAALATGMAVGQVTKVMSVWCPHRKKIVLQVLHDDDRQPNNNPTTTADADEAWTRFATTNAPSTITTTNSQGIVQTPENAIRVYTGDSVVKTLLPQLNAEDDEYKLKQVVAEHMKAVYEPKILQIEEAHRQTNLANETEIRRLTNLLAQQTDTKTTTKDKTEKLPPVATYDAWGPAAEQRRFEKETITNQSPLATKMDTPDKEEEEYLLMRLRCEAYDLKSNGKSMPKGHVVVKGRLIHDYHTRLQTILDTLATTKQPTAMIKFGINKEAVRGNKEIQECDKSQRISKTSYNSPDSGGSSGRRGQGNGTPEILNLGPGKPNGPPDDDDDDDEPGNPGTPDYDNYNNNDRTGNGGEDRRSREFQLVNPRNINIAQFIGKQFNTNPYMPFNNGIRNFIMTQGQDGEELLEILNHVETYGGEKFTNKYLHNLSKQKPKAYEYSRAIMAALMNWTGGIAKGLIKHGVDNGLDAWRKLYHKYVPLAEDLHNILIQELMGLKRIVENDIDQVFADIERIRDLYAKAGTDDNDISDKWIRAAVLRNLPDSIFKLHAMELKKADNIEEMHSIINAYQFDHSTGLPRGQYGPGLYSTETDTGKEEEESLGIRTVGGETEHTSNNEKITITTTTEDGTIGTTIGGNDGEMNTVPRGGNKPKGGKGGKKGYGECWHCGEWGHPRRECPKLLAGKGGGSVAALKGKFGYEGKGNTERDGKEKAKAKVVDTDPQARQ